MARPLRSQWKARTLVRRRHRTWMASMVLATAGWGVIWLRVALLRVAPEWAPGVTPTLIVACVPAAVGFFLGFFTIRAKLIWLLLAGVPMFANGSLLLLPVLESSLFDPVVSERPDAP